MPTDRYIPLDRVFAELGDAEDAEDVEDLALRSYIGRSLVRRGGDVVVPGIDVTPPLLTRKR